MRLIVMALMLIQITVTGAALRVATFNLENYVGAGAARPAKPPEAKAQVVETLAALNADVLALQEMGGSNILAGLRLDLLRAGLNYPYAEHVPGHDTNIFPAILSKYPIAARRPHTNEGFLLYGRRFQTSRGFGEVDIQVDSYRFTLITAHLKSKRPSASGDEAVIREQEARLLRAIIDQRLRDTPQINLIVLGDFNDTPDSDPVRLLIGKGKAALVDTRPQERNGDTSSAGSDSHHSRSIAWTHYFAREDTYARLDYILLSRGMAREWIQSETCVFAVPHWGLASDHRPILAAFQPMDL